MRSGFGFRRSANEILLNCRAYEPIYRLEGVERATASFKEGRVTAVIDPEETSREKLETAVKQRGVQLAAAE
jgi:hypothetical protein